jgi:hypothetical protein
VLTWVSQLDRCSPYCALRIHSSTTSVSRAVRAHRTEDSTRAQYRRTARHVAHPRVGAAGPVRRARAQVHCGTIIRTTTTAPPATRARARLPGPTRWFVGRRLWTSSSRLRACGRRRLGKGGGSASGV